MDAEDYHYIRPTVRGDDYRDILASLTQLGKSLCLIGDTSMAAAGFELGAAEPMSRFLLKQDQVSAWPGTALLDGNYATRFTFEFSDTSLRIWLGLVDELFAEAKLGFRDLHVLRQGGSPLFASISGHSTAWLQMDEREFEAWRAGVSPEVLQLVTDEARLPGAVTALGVLAGSKIGGSLSAADLTPWLNDLPASDRQVVADYLEQGHCVIPVIGETRDDVGDQFRVKDGADILTDGKYFWRRDAADYVREYLIGVTSEALEYIRSRQLVINSISESEIDDISNYLWSFL